MAENKQYITQTQENGTLKIAQEVIETIAAQALCDVEGVVALNIKPNADISEVVSKKNWGKSLKITIGQEDELYVECNVIIEYGQSVVNVAKTAQETLSSAIESMTGLKVAAVNVNICGIVRK